MSEAERNLAAAQRAYDRQLPEDPPEDPVASLRLQIEARLDELTRIERLALADHLIDLFGLLDLAEFESVLVDMQTEVT